MSRSFVHCVVCFDPAIRMDLDVGSFHNSGSHINGWLGSKTLRIYRQPNRAPKLTLPWSLTTCLSQTKFLLICSRAMMAHFLQIPLKNLIIYSKPLYYFKPCQKQPIGVNREDVHKNKWKPKPGLGMPEVASRRG